MLTQSKVAVESTDFVFLFFLILCLLSIIFILHFMTPRLSKIITDSNTFRKKDNTNGPSTRDSNEPETFQLTPASPSPWKSKVPDSKLDAIRRHFASLDRSKLNEVNDDIENTWDCGIW